MTEHDEPIRLSVSPAPNPEEMAAISAVVAGLISSQSNGGDDEQGSTGGGRERWAKAGRREVLRPMDRDGASQGIF